MGTNKIKTVIAAAIIIMISLAFYVPNVSAMDTAAREFETACKKSTGNITAVRFKVEDPGTAAATNSGTAPTPSLTEGGVGTLNIPGASGGQCTLQIGTGGEGKSSSTSDNISITGAKIKLDNGETLTLSKTNPGDGSVKATGPLVADIPGYSTRNVSTVLSQFGTINRLVLGILPLLLLLTSFAYGALLVTGTGENISDSVKAEVGGLVVLQIVTSFLPSILQFLVTAAGATDGQYGVTGDFGGIIDIIFGVIPIVMVVAIIALIGQRIYREASDRGMMSGAGLA